MEAARRFSSPSGGQPLASASPARRQDFAPTLGGHALAETVTALTYKLARLISPLHVQFSATLWGREDVVLGNALKPEFSASIDFARLIREGPWPVNETLFV